MKIKFNSHIVHSGMEEALYVSRATSEDIVFVQVTETDFEHFKILPMYNWELENGTYKGVVPFKKDALVCQMAFKADYLVHTPTYVKMNFFCGEESEQVEFKILEDNLGIEILEKSLNFGTLKVGQSFDHEFEIKNTSEYEIQVNSFYCNLPNSIVFGDIQPIKIKPGKTAKRSIQATVLRPFDITRTALLVTYEVGGISISSKFKMAINISGVDNSSLPFKVSVLPIKVNGISKTGVTEIEHFVGDAIRVLGVEGAEVISVPIKVSAETDQSIRVIGATITGGELISVVKRPEASQIEVDGFDSTTLGFSFIPNKIEGIASVKVSFSMLYGESKQDVVLDIVWGVSKN